MIFTVPTQLVMKNNKRLQFIRITELEVQIIQTELNIKIQVFHTSKSPKKISYANALRPKP